MSAFQMPSNVGATLLLSEVSPDCKPIVVGIDFGTSYSGIAFATRGDPASLWMGAPGINDSLQTKVPTALLRYMENGKEVWKFGHEAELMYSNMLQAREPNSTAPYSKRLFKRFKMVLEGQTTGYDTLQAFSADGQLFSLMVLITQSLRILKEFALKKVSQSYGDSFDAFKEIQWVLTVPAIWNDFGKAFMRKAAHKAGLTKDEQSDNLVLVLEPEGAALAVHAFATHQKLLGLNRRFMVLDCGGGTVDITTYEVTCVKPLTKKEIAIAGGGPWGAENVNLEFKKFLKELLGPTLYKEQTAGAEFYGIFAEFERVKMAFEPSGLPNNIRLIDVLDRRNQLVELATVYNANHPDKPIIIGSTLRNGFLTMSKELMLSFFVDSLNDTVSATRHLLNTIPDINYIMVVGGYGSSNTLVERITDEFQTKRGVQVVVPVRPQSAIVHGAVLCGMYKHIVLSRVSPHTYGVAMRNVDDKTKDLFKVLVRKGDDLPINSIRSQSGLPDKDSAEVTLTWAVHRSELQDPEFITYFTPRVGFLDVKCPVDKDWLKREQCGKFEFGGTEIRVSIVNGIKEEYKIEMRM